MEIMLKAEEWRKMTTVERIRRCRLLAQEARNDAERASTTLSPFYSDMSAQWLKLAVVIDAESRYGAKSSC
jgi:hypothetical protein